MKALTLHQPWASLMAAGVKRVETRSWSTDYRGPIAIHAGRVWTAEYAELVETWPFGDYLSSETVQRIEHGELRGCVLAVGTLRECFRMTRSMVRRMEEFGGQLEHGQIDASVQRYGPEWFFGLWEPGRYGWLIEDVRAIDPVPCRGMQGLWEWEHTA